MQATIVSDDWANAVQEEICGVIIAASIALDKTAQNQLLLAIQALITAGAGAGVPDATTSVKGKVELATDAETITGTDAVRAVTPAGAAATYVGLAGDTLTGALNGPAFNTTSSRRYKRKIKKIKPADALELLASIRVVGYELKKGGQYRIGVIAEELAAGPLADFVVADKHGKIEAVNYESLFSLAMAALQASIAETQAIDKRLGKIERALAKRD